MKRHCFYRLYIAMVAGMALFQPGCAPARDVMAAEPAASADVVPSKLTLPLTDGSVRFAVIGDTGTGDREQYETGRMLTHYHLAFPFEFVIMMGDNMYGGEDPDDYLEKFERPYQELLNAKVKFYASLGNHDDAAQRFYEHFNMNGERYYTFTQGNIRFFALESGYMDPDQLKWLEEQLAKSNSEWKIVFFHHPIYSSGSKHGADLSLREVLEPLFVRYGVGAVFVGHEHFYERIKPQKDIYYFISGAGGKLRYGNIRQTDITAKGFDTDRSFMLVEVVDDRLHFQVISRTGATVDSGVLVLLRNQKEAA